MTTRERILAEIKANKPAETTLPEIQQFAGFNNSLFEQFITVLTGIGGVCTRVENEQSLVELMNEEKQGGGFVQAIQGLPGFNGDTIANANANELQHIKVVFIKGTLGVAENGSIWVREQDMQNRLLPFICERLVLVVNEDSIVTNMHEAYEKIQVDEDGYGVFIAGPSKTADIEQSLVIGAHGPLSLQVMLVAG